MGQKVNPIGLRLGINRTWDSRWYAEGAEYSKMLHEDIQIRKVLRKKLAQAGVAKIVIERPAKRARVTIHTARPGVVIGKKGADIEKLRGDLAKMTKGEVALNIVEIRKPEIDATLIAGGIRINCSGRLGGSEIARMEWYREGRVPLHTLRADIDYGIATAFTTFGTCGVKVWVFKGEIMAHDPMAHDKRAEEAAPQRTPARVERTEQRDA